MSDLARLMEIARLYDRAVEEGLIPPDYGVMPPVNTDVPFVSGTAAIGSILSCTMGNWSGEPTSYAYQWLSDGATVIGVDDDTYTIADTDAGHSITCVVTATNAKGSVAAPPSNAIDVPAAATEAAARPSRAPAHDDARHPDTPPERNEHRRRGS